MKLYTLVILLFSYSSYAEESIYSRAMYVSVKRDILSQLSSACNLQLAKLNRESIDSDECKAFIKAINSEFYTSIEKECKSLLQYREKNKEKGKYGSEFYIDHQKESESIIAEIQEISKACPFDGFPQTVLKIRAIKELNK